MADPYVIFPGTSDHIATPDVNLLDADTAHIQQSVGGWDKWVSTNNVAQSQWVAPTFGDYVLQWPEGTGATSGIFNDIPGEYFPAAEGTIHSCSFVFYNQSSVDLTVEGFVRYRDVSGSQLRQDSLSSLIVAAGSSAMFTATTPASPSSTTQAGMLLRVGNTGHPIPAGEFCYSDAHVFREGTDPAFVPSLNIVGTLYEEIVPVDMPIVYTPGSPLTVGEGWIGNGYSYARYDGADASAPVVASFQAEDVPVATQLPN